MNDRYIDKIVNSYDINKYNWRKCVCLESLYELEIGKIYEYFIDNYNNFYIKNVNDSTVVTYGRRILSKSFFNKHMIDSMKLRESNLELLLK
jgi:hypothetical protein